MQAYNKIISLSGQKQTPLCSTGLHSQDCGSLSSSMQRTAEMQSHFKQVSSRRKCFRMLLADHKATHQVSLG